MQGLLEGTDTDPITPIAPKAVVEQHLRGAVQRQWFGQFSPDSSANRPAQEFCLLRTVDEGGPHQGPLQAGQVGVFRNRFQVYLGLPSGPRLPGQQHLGFVLVIADEIAEGQFLAGFAGKGLQPVRHLDIQALEVCADVVQHVLPGLAVQLNGAPRRQVGKIERHLPVDGKPVSGQQCLELAVEPVAAVHLTDKIQHREAVLARGMAQAAAQLLEEDGQTFGGAQEQDDVDLRHIDAFAQFVHREEKGEPAAPQVLEQPGTLLAVRVGNKGG